LIKASYAANSNEEHSIMKTGGIAAIVTGAVSGLGEAKTHALAEVGAKLGILDKDFRW
tara:strand:+ start:274 stop:447 length:174 start_codon:yes stop_codon:yes gene_type:complete